MSLEKTAIKTALTPIDFLPFKLQHIEVWVKRDDLNHPTVQGNKWHKLLYNLKQAKAENCDTLITFGGAYSNHIAATAAAAKSEGFKSIGIIRGDELQHHPDNWSHTLKQAQANGMEFKFVSRQEYKQRHNPSYIDDLKQQYPNSYVLPEGGSNQLAILGFEELMDQINQQCPDWTHLFCAVGTGATLAGLVSFANSGLQREQHIKRQLFGIPVLKKAKYLIPDIENWIKITQISKQVENWAEVNWQLLTQYHDGGYGKQSQQGKDFQQHFEEQFNILLDPIYTNKTAYALFDQVQTKQIPPGSKVIMLHTGGLQGRFNQPKSG